MSKQYHFVVSYDTDTCEWSVEPDVSLNFDNGDVWDKSLEEWSTNTCDTIEESEITTAVWKIMRNADPVELEVE